MELRIDVHDGTVDLPNGIRLSPTRTRNHLRADPRLPAARLRTGAPPWLHVDFESGPLGGHALLVTATFCAQHLMSVSFTVRLPPAAGWAGNDWQLAHDLATKAAHDRLLTTLLGEPCKAMAAGAPDTTGPGMLRYAKWWQFAWGRIGSLHDGNGGGTFVRVVHEHRRPSP